MGADGLIVEVYRVEDETFFKTAAVGLVIVIGATVYNFRIEMVQPEPSMISKLNTFLQIGLAAAGVIQLGFGGVPDWLLNALIWAVMVTVVLSGAGYVREWSRRAAAHARR